MEWRRAKAVKPGSRVAFSWQVHVGHDQGSGATHLSPRRHFRRGNSSLPCGRLRRVAVDLRRLPAAGRSRIPGLRAGILPTTTRRNARGLIVHTAAYRGWTLTIMQVAIPKPAI